jgi:antirestriction protein ArdC
MPRAYVVFNVAQVDGLPAIAAPEPLPIPERHQSADGFVEATAGEIRDGPEAMFRVHLCITGELRHAGYRIELLRDDNRAIFTAASKASQAADFLRSFSEPDGREPDADSP